MTMSVLFSSGFPVSGLLLPEDGNDVEVCLEFPIKPMRAIEARFKKPIIEVLTNIGKWKIDDFLYVFLRGLQSGSHPHMEAKPLEELVNLNVVMGVMRGISEAAAKAIQGDEKGADKKDEEESEGNEEGW